MVDVPSAILAALGSGGAGVRLLQASFVSAGTTGALIDVQGSRVPAAMGTDFLPEVGEIVNVWNIDDRYLIMGPAAVKPDTGTVQSVTGGYVTLLTPIGTTVTCPYDGSAVTPSAGQVMKLLWRNGAFAMLMSTSPAVVVPPPPPGVTTRSHVDPFFAADSGSYGSGRWWTDQVWGSDSNLGAFFYGTQIADTIPSTASISQVQVYISPNLISGSNPVVAVHSYTSKPGGSPALASVTAVAMTPGWVDLPISIGDNLKNGGGYFGIGLNHGGKNILNSRNADVMSGKLAITSTY